MSLRLCAFLWLTVVYILLARRFCLRDEFAECCAYLALATVAFHRECDFRSRRCRCDGIAKRVRIGDARPVKCSDDVAGAKARAIRSASRLNLVNHDARSLGHS